MNIWPDLRENMGTLTGFLGLARKDGKSKRVKFDPSGMSLMVKLEPKLAKRMGGLAASANLIALAFVFTLLLGVTFGETAVWAQSGGGGCLQLLRSVICPPPNGDLATDIRGQVVCGPGHCARNRRGAVICSAAPGGAVAIDISGNVLCVGGCVQGDNKYCVVPVQ